MEALPRLPMVSFDLKVSPESVAFGPKLKQYISEAYREDPESYSNDIHQLESLRSAAVRAANDATGCAALKRYFCQLRALETRFPMAKGQPAAVTFSWRDLYANMVCSVADIRLELASILYNMAAMHTRLGAEEARVSADSLKASVTHFQNAAWLFTYLRETYPQPPGVDLAPDVLRALREICLAQGQECIVEKSLVDNKKPSIIGSLAMQVVQFYKSALTLLGPASGQDTLFETMGPKLHGYFTKYCKFQITYNYSLIYLYMGMSAEEQQKMGERVACYQVASDKLHELRKLSKGIFDMDAFNVTFSFINDVVEAKRKAAKNENEFIYHEEVPAKDLLNEPKPVPLVKDIPVDFDDPEVTGPLVFSRLVPLKAHEVSSIYSEEKAKLLRRVSGQTEKKNQDLQDFLSSLQLEQLCLLEGGSGGLPQALVDRCAALSARPSLTADLSAGMNDLAGLREDAHSTLATIQEALQAEETECRNAQRAPSLMLADLQREFTKYSDAHVKADESNQVLHKAMTLHLANLKLLAQPLEVLEEKIPSIENLEFDRSGLIEMRRVADKATEMQIQRDSLLSELRVIFAADDITPRLLASGVTVGSREQSILFAKELHKHAPKLNIIRQNLTAQDNIIKRLTELYAEQADNRRTLADTARRRDALINALITSYDAYEDLLGKARKGIEFYKKLLVNVNQLSARVRSVCQVSREERQQLCVAAAQKEKPSSHSASLKQVEIDSDASLSPTPGLATLPSAPSAPKLKDYLPYMRNRKAATQPHAVMDISYLPAIRPAPLGSDGTNETPYNQSIDGAYYKDYQQNDPSTGPYHAIPQALSTDNPYHVRSTPYAPPLNYHAEEPRVIPQSIPGNVSFDQQAFGYAQNITYPPQPQEISSQINPASSLPQVYPQSSTPSFYPQYDQNVSQTPNESVNSYPLPYSLNQNFSINSAAQNADHNLISQPYYKDNIDTNGIVPQSDYNTTSYIQKHMSQVQISDPQYATSSYPQYQAQPFSSSYSQPYNAQAQDLSAKSSESTFADCSTAESLHSQYYSCSSSEQATTPIISHINNSSNYASTVFGLPIQSEGNAMYASAYPNSYSENMAAEVIPYNYNTNVMQVGQAGENVSYTSPVPSQATSYTVVTNYQYPSQMQSFVNQPATLAGLPADSSQYQSNSGNFHQNNETQSYIPPYPHSGYQNEPDLTNAQGTDNSQSAQSGQNSYGNHPGYGYSSTSGSYEYSSGYQQDHNHQQVDQNTHQNYNENIYSNAGSYGTLQTASGSQGEGAEKQPSKYYSVPYGYQSVNGTTTEVVTGSETAQQNATYVSSGNVNTSVTYTSKDDTATNVTQNEEISDECNEMNAAEEQSNLDLLAGLDFAVDLPTLTPEIKVPPVSESAIRKLLPSKNQSVIDKLTESNEGIEIYNIDRPAKRDIFSDPGLVNKFTQEVKILHRFIDSLADKTQNGITILDAKWMEIHQLQSEKCTQKSTDAASSVDGDRGITANVIPYDDHRVILENSPSTYINASFIRQLSPWCPPLILSSIPQDAEQINFWTMVVQYQVATIVCLLTEIELQGSCHWPTTKGHEMQMGSNLKVTLQESTCTVHWTERRLLIDLHGKQHQLTHYHINIFPAKVICAPLILLADNILRTSGFYKTSCMQSVLLQCDGGREGVYGGGRSALLALILMLVSEVRTGRVNLCDMLQNGCVSLCEARKNVLEDTKNLMDVYRTSLFYAQGVLCSGTTAFNGELVMASSAATAGQGTLQVSNILPSTSSSQHQSSSQPQGNTKLKKFSKESFEDMKQAAGLKSGDMKDPLSFLDPLWSLKKK